MRAVLITLLAITVIRYGLGWHFSLWQALAACAVVALLARSPRTRTVRPPLEPGLLPPLGGFAKPRASSGQSQATETPLVTRINAATGSSTGTTADPPGEPGARSAAAATLRQRLAPSKPGGLTYSGEPEAGNPGQPLEAAGLPDVGRCPCGRPIVDCGAEGCDTIVRARTGS